MDDREVSHKLSRPSDILFLLKSLLYTHHRACSSSPCRLSCPPCLAVCCSWKQLNHRQAQGGLARRRLWVLLLIGQREGAQLYQQDPLCQRWCSATSVSTENGHRRWTALLSVWDRMWPLLPPTPWFASVSCISFPQPRTPAFLERGNQPETLSKNARYAMVQ